MTATPYSKIFKMLRNSGHFFDIDKGFGGVKLKKALKQDYVFKCQK